ncbi:MAG: hypothetical protein AAGC73_01450 [Verrucomicrobiota bacterium]
MAIDWQIKTIAQKSALSGDSFEPGQKIVCLIFKDPQAAEIGRTDILDSEVEDFSIPGEPLGRWTRVFKDPSAEGVSVQETMSSAEDLFFSLYEVEVSLAMEESDALKHLLGLMLERKRILRVTGPRRTSGSQTYLHAKRKTEIEVPIVDISPELMIAIQDTLSDLVM